MRIKVNSTELICESGIKAHSDTKIPRAAEIGGGNDTFNEVFNYRALKKTYGHATSRASITSCR